MDGLLGIKRFIAKTSGVLFYSVKYGCILHCLFEYVGTIVKTVGPSMQPTIFSGDILLAENFSVDQQWIKKGDVVACKSPNEPLSTICKRVVALEGDTVFCGPLRKTITVPKGHVWVEGDNKDNSKDSRHYGPIPYALLSARVFYKVWPLHDRGSLRLPKECS